MDDARIATEVTIFADKICVDEETVRLKSHIEAMKAALTGGGPGDEPGSKYDSFQGK